MTGTRWTSRRKLETLQDLDAGKITPADLAQHDITPEEISEWRALSAKAGTKALRATKLQLYRKNPLPKRRGRN